MALQLYYHPLASFCHKALIALYEHAVDFERIIVDLQDAASSAAFRALWPIAKMPVLRDEGRNCTVAESTIVVEYLDSFYSGAARLVPAAPDRAWRARLWDRFHDHYVQHPMQKIVTDRLRPAGSGDAYGVEQATAQLRDAYRILDQEMDGKRWAIGEAFTLADCAAAPALFYADTALPIDAEQPHLLAYLERLLARPSFARVLEEAEPYFAYFPLERKPRIDRTQAVAHG